MGRAHSSLLGTGSHWPLPGPFKVINFYFKREINQSTDETQARRDGPYHRENVEEDHPTRFEILL